MLKQLKKKLSSKVRYRNTVLCFITNMESIVTVMMEMTAPKSRLCGLINNDIFTDFSNDFLNSLNKIK